MKGPPQEHCEVTNNHYTTNPCIDAHPVEIDSSETNEILGSKSTAEAPAQKVREAVSSFEPWQCVEGPSAFAPVMAAIAAGRLDEMQDYCTSIGYGP
jgi:hypothetical protein